MRKLSLGLFCLGLLTNAALASSTSGSMSKSCSGTLDGQYFYLYAYQYAYVYDGKVKTETHTFTMTGALGNSAEYVLDSKEPIGNHLVYKGPRGYLLVPFVSGESIYLQKPTRAPYPDRKIVLCE